MVSTMNVVFNSENLLLEGRLNLPGDRGLFPVVVICHPHSQMGGSMDNNVVDTICEELLARGIAAFKFNFRGVEGSQGDFDHGRGEQVDACSAVKYVSGLPQIDNHRIGLAGYSAGAAWGIGGTCGEDKVRAVAAVSPPLALFDFSFLKKCHKPKLLITGDRDQFVDILGYRRFVGQLMPDIKSIVVAGADHFWSNNVSKMAQNVAEHFSIFL